MSTIDRQGLQALLVHLETAAILEEIARERGQAPLSGPASALRAYVRRQVLARVCGELPEVPPTPPWQSHG